jgi:hypothetical protein
LFNHFQRGEDRSAIGRKSAEATTDKRRERSLAPRVRDRINELIAADEGPPRGRKTRAVRQVVDEFDISERSAWDYCNSLSDSQ